MSLLHCIQSDKVEKEFELTVWKLTDIKKTDSSAGRVPASLSQTDTSFMKHS